MRKEAVDGWSAPNLATVLGPLLRAPVRLWRWPGGLLAEHRFLRLTHLGRFSGRRSQSMLEIVGAGSTPGEVIVSAGFGSAADWYRDVQAHPAIEVALSDRRFRPAHRILDEPEVVAVLAAYEQSHRWITQLLRDQVNWCYDGTDRARRRLARELTLVAFRPTAR